MHEYLKTVPVDIYELHLFQLVAEQRSFTKAAATAGLTQSAVTRQVQAMEQSLGVTLFERTTRSVRPTEAGAMLLAESRQLLGSVEDMLRRIREDYAQARKEVRVGVSRSIGLAYLPGFFHANLRRLPQVGYRVRYQASSEILSALEANELDLGVLSPPRRLPDTLRVTHRFDDAFVLIGSADTAEIPARASRKTLETWARAQNWLLIDSHSNSGQQLRTWLRRQKLTIEPGMTLDSFDLIINLVALGMGVSFVPIRALALYSGKKNLRRLRWPDRFTRELVVVVRRNRKMPDHLQQFMQNVLF